MEELSKSIEKILVRSQKCQSEWENEMKEIQLKLEAVLLGTQAPVQQTFSNSGPAVVASPQQMKKRAKRLSAVVDDEGDLLEIQLEHVHGKEQASGCVADEQDLVERLSANLVANAPSTVVNETILPELVVQKQEPPEIEHVFARPTRAAKLKIEGLKEPSLTAKMRRDAANDTIKKIKKEKDASPTRESTKRNKKASKAQTEKPLGQSINESIASNKKGDDSVVVCADKESPPVEIFSEEDDASSNASAVVKKKAKKEPTKKSAVIKIKKEKLSTSGMDSQEEVPPSPVPAAAVEVPVAPQVAPEEPPAETTVASLPSEVTASTEDTLQTTTSTTAKKRGRKKKEFLHKPIKEERLSIEVPAASPISTRTRSGSVSKPRPLSVYEDAIDKMPQERSLKEVPEQIAQLPTSQSGTPNNCNETVTTNNATMMTAADATFAANQGNATFAMPAPQTTFIMENNPNSTVTISNDAAKKPSGSIGDATFDVRDLGNRDSIMTEDDSFEKPLKQLLPVPTEIIPNSQPPTLPRVLKPKSKMNELFNPCVRSPVKKKVEAFEHHAQVAAQDNRPKPKSKQTKENAEPELASTKELRSCSVTTPVIGKPHAPVLGRFLTPTQQSNLTPSAGNAKKLPNSASKIMPFPTTRQMSATNLKGSSSTSSLSRENSEEDLKKGFNKLQQQAEERKKKRELKHQQAALLREAKEKERAERLKKIMKEREEKNRKKVLEMEQKKRELEEINRNLKLQEEREQKQAAKTKLDPAEVARQERELLEQMKLQKMKMPPPKQQQQNKYNFNMLHSDDSTDEEGKTSYKRPAPPLWSRSSVRTEHISYQSHLPTDIIDSFFSVQPMTPDLKAIFPNIDPRYLKRNSSAIWQTPPRYSEMPKY